MTSCAHGAMAARLGQVRGPGSRSFFFL